MASITLHSLYMLTTILLTLMMMAGLFLLLYAGVGLIQNPRFFSSAPKEVCAAVQPKPERFKGAHFHLCESKHGYSCPTGCITVALHRFGCPER